VPDGEVRLRLMAVSGIATVLVTRAYLAATGYPQVGNGTLHIGHVVWGGLLMIAALTIALMWGGAARTPTALLGGVGIGLFVDEVGKYLTRTNDYFFRPAAAIIYLVFAALLVVAALLRQDAAAVSEHDEGVRLAMAARIAADGLAGGLTSAERERAELLLDGCAPEERDAALRLLAGAPTRQPGRIARLGATLRRWGTRAADLPYAEAVMFALLAISHVAVAIVFIAQAVTGEPHSTDAGAITAGAVTRVISLVLILAALAVRPRSRFGAYRLCRAAILVDLLISEVFNFNDSQFGALGELPFLLLALAFFGYRLKGEQALTTAAARGCGA